MFFGLYYIRWHYTQALLDIIGIIRNFVWFFYEFFSIPLLLRTLFSPFHRLGEHYVSSLDLWKWFETFIVNTLMRLVGFFLRSILIILGIFFLLLTVVVGFVFLLAWILAPLLLIFLVGFGLKLISVG